MNQQHNSKLTGAAQNLRKNMTKEERRLWYDFLKGLPVMVHRQKVIGNYIADFYIAEKKAVIEVDGSQHYMTQGWCQDYLRDEYFRSLGIVVLRYANSDVNLHFEAVCQDIWCKLSMDEKKPSP